jgi:hypothetical protein
MPSGESSSLPSPRMGSSSTVKGPRTSSSSCRDLPQLPVLEDMALARFKDFPWASLIDTTSSNESRRC